MEDLAPVIIIFLIVFWNVIVKITGAVRKVLMNYTRRAEPEVITGNQSWKKYEPQYSVRVTPRQKTQDKDIMEIDDADIIDSEHQPVIKKAAAKNMYSSKQSRQKLRQAIVWSEILAPPLALRENHPEL